jgi:hypothetical protein
MYGIRNLMRLPCAPSTTEHLDTFNVDTVITYRVEMAIAVIVLACRASGFAEHLMAADG